MQNIPNKDLGLKIVSSFIAYPKGVSFKFTPTNSTLSSCIVALSIVSQLCGYNKSVAKRRRFEGVVYNARYHGNITFHTYGFQYNFKKFSEYRHLSFRKFNI